MKDEEKTKEQLIDDLHKLRQQLDELKKSEAIHKQTDEALRESEAKWRSITENSPDHIMLLDRNANIQFINRTVPDLSKEEVIGKSVYSYTPSEFHKVASDCFKHVLETGEPETYGTQYVTKEGEVRYFDVRVSPILHHGEVIALISSSTDITERKHIEGELKKSEEKFRYLVENISEIIYSVDEKGEVIYVSPAIEVAIGYKTSELIGHSFDEFIYPEDLPRCQKEFQTVLSGHETAGDYRFLTKSGEIRWIRTSNRPAFKDNHVIGASGVLTDISDLIQAEEQIKTSLKEKETLLREIHHRVKNNLQIIISLLRLQSRYFKETQSIDLIKASQDRIKSMALIHEKLYQSKDLARFDFGEYIRGLTSHLFQSAIWNTSAVQLEINAERISLDINKAIPCGLIINELVSNALKHAFPEGGKGIVRIDLHPHEKGKYTLVVSDNGVGFPEKIDFRDTKTLGLQLVNDLIGQLKGTIELDRKDGTTFKLTF